METLTYEPTTAKLIIDLTHKLLSSPFLFLIVVILIYIVLPKLKRESVNNEVIKLIRAIKSNGKIDP